MDFILPKALTFLLIASSYLSFSQQDTISVVQEIKIIGNKTTKERIIYRELPFELGDSIKSAEITDILKRTKSNLLNTLLFNFVTVDPVFFDTQNVSIYIMVEERWYWWPIPIFEIQETNLNTWWQTKDLDKLNYGMYIAKENFRGRKERLRFIFQDGYTQRFGMNYSIPYINKNQTQGLNIKISYSTNHEVNYATTNNVRDFYKNNNKDVKTQIKSSIGYEYRPRLYNQHNINLKLTNVKLNDSILIYNSDFLPDSSSKSSFFSLQYSFERDKRNFKSYPTLGYYFDASVVKDGLQLVDKNIDKLYISAQAGKYWRLTQKIFLSQFVKGQYTFKEGPYILYDGLGYVNNLVRGYEYYVIRGEHYFLSKTQIRYQLLNNKIFKFGLIPSEKFNKIPLSIYMGLFFDAGYVESKINPENNFLTNTLLIGSGVAIDIVSYYDMVLRLEYSINKLEEHGFFIHFVAPL